MSKENQSLVPLTQELVKTFLESDEKFIVNLNDAWKWSGYSKKENSLHLLKKNFSENQDYIVFLNVQEKAKGRPSHTYMLSADCFKELSMLSQTEQGKKVRSYFLECEKKLKTIHKQQRELTPAEALLESAQLLVKIERQQKALEEGLTKTTNKIDNLLEERDSNMKKLFEIQRSQVLPLQKSCKALIKQLVEAYVKASGLSYGEVWGKLYNEFNVRYNTNVSVKAKNRQVTVLDYIESIMMLEQLFSIASHILVLEDK